MNSKIFHLASALQKQNRKYVLATVVRRLKPISGRVGDKAIIYEDGSITGWIGGGCSKPIVVTEALKALKTGRSKLIRITPKLSADPIEGITEFKMTCHSGGTLDVYIEPVLDLPQLIIMGRSIVGQSLAKLAKQMDYDIHVYSKGDLDGIYTEIDNITPDFALEKLEVTDNSYVVVATQGEYDEVALEEALTKRVKYIGFVSSKKKWSKIVEYFTEKGISDNTLARIKVPAGLDLNARTSDDIAISIIAEIIMKSGEDVDSEIEVLQPTDSLKMETRDPVCGMMVDPETTEISSRFDDQDYYFCCPHCKEAFDNNPKKFIQVM